MLANMLATDEMESRAQNTPKPVVTPSTPNATSWGVRTSRAGIFQSAQTYRQHAKTMCGFIGDSGLMTTITGQGKPEELFGEIVSGNYFNVSGALLRWGVDFCQLKTPLRPRTQSLLSVIVCGSGGLVAIRALSPAVSLLDGNAFTVVGVAGVKFNGLLFRGLSADLWAPTKMMGQLRTDRLSNRDERWMFVKGRQAKGGTSERAAAEIVCWERNFRVNSIQQSIAQLCRDDQNQHPADAQTSVQPITNLAFSRNDN